MRPVDLSPTRAAGAGLGSGGPSRTAIGTGALVGVGVLVAGLYFGISSVSSLNGEAARLTDGTAAAEGRIRQVNQELADLRGRPIEKGWDVVAREAASQVVSRYEARDDYTRLVRDLRLVVPDDGVSGLSKVSVGAASEEVNGAEDGVITIAGVAPSVEAVMSIIALIDATPTMDDATVVSITPAPVKAAGRTRTYREFTITARIDLGGVDRTSGDGGTSGSTTVSSGGLSLQIESSPSLSGVAGSGALASRTEAPPDPLHGLLRDTSTLGGG